MTDLTLTKHEQAQTQPTDNPPKNVKNTDTTIPTTRDDSDQLPKDLIFGLLRNRRRRWTLKYLAEREAETSLSELAEHIASIENDKSVAALSSDERKRVYVGLYQVHLPKMDDANVIDYNQPRGTITLRPEANQLLTYLTTDRHTTNQPESWYHHLIPSPLRTLWTKYRE